MKKLINSVIILTLVSLVAMSCQSEKKQENSNSGEKSELEMKQAMSVLNANLATEEELKSIGLNDEMVSQILENRPFITMSEFDELLGTDLDKEALYFKVFVPFNLNTTAEEDFKMIPGVGERMAHEFDEYRPYQSILQFRREIGKYVEEAEVTRYENYVFVPVELNSASEEDIKALPGMTDHMAHEFEEYRPYESMDQFYQEISKYVDNQELDRLARLVYISEN